MQNQHNPVRENLAGKLARLFIESKLTVIFVLAIAVSGILAILLTPREENPQIIMPAARVTVSMPGASAAEVEELIVTPLEGLLSGISGVDHTDGAAMNSVGTVTVMFKVGQPKEESLVKVNDRIRSNISLLPAEAGDPVIQGIDSDDVPIITITLASGSLDDFALKRVADRMAERLRSTKDVSLVTVHEGRSREISIELDPVRIQAFGLSLSQAYAAISSNNLTVPYDATVQHKKVEAIKLSGAFSSAEEVRNLIISVNDGRPIYVKDVATVRDGPPEELESFSRFSFGSGDIRSQQADTRDMAAVTIAVSKKKNTNAVVVSDSVIDRVERMKTSMVPNEINVIVTRNDGKKADDAVNMLMEHLVIAVVTVSGILIVFLGWREALIVTVTIPLIFSLTLASDFLGGVTINRVTLFALILSLGLLVDAAIVVIENIHRHYGQAKAGADKTKVTILATNEIGNATNLATLAVILVFASLFLITGMPGDYFYPIAYNVPIAMAGSILVAYIVTPWAANRWVKWHPRQSANDLEDQKGDKHQEPGRLERAYLFLYTPLQNSNLIKMGFLCVILLLMTGSLLQGAWQFIRPQGVGGPQSEFGVNIGFLPKDNKNTFNIVIYMAADDPLEKTDQLTREISALLSSNPLVENYQSWVGKAGVADFNGMFKGTSGRTGNSVAEIRVNLIDKHEREESSIEIVQELRPLIEEIRSKYPGAKVSLVEDPPGPPLRSTVLAEIYGPDPEGLRALSEQVQEAFKNTYDMVDLVDTEPRDVLEHRLMPEKDKAALSLVSTADINEVLGLVYGGKTLGRVHLPDETNAVLIRAFVPRRFAVNPEKLDSLYVANQIGDQVPLSELVRDIHAIQDRTINHRDNEKATFVGGEMGKSVPLYAVIDLNRRLKEITAPDGRSLKTGNLNLVRDVPDTVDGYQVLWGGEMRMTLDVYRDMAIALGGALTLVFLLLVAYYKSFSIPAIAMSSVPLGLIGIFPGHWLFGADFSATSMVGIIALSGVVIRNSLLIIDFVQDNIKQGMVLSEATKQAGAVRLRPILLTTLAIILGTAIMTTDPVFGGLAISLIFGTILSTLLTVFVVPVLYYVNASRMMT
nr:efflux RND transporter permease subunit [uncultured Cohaesibacter sp.]